MTGRLFLYVSVVLSLGLSSIVANANANASDRDIFHVDLISSIGTKADLLPIEVTLNGDKVVAQNVLRTPKGPALSEADANKARLQWAGELFTYAGDGWVLVSQLAGADHTYDAAAARLALNVRAQDLAIQKVDKAKLVAPKPTAIPALITQYDWYSTSFSNSSGGQHATTTTAAVEHIFSLGALRFNQSWGVNFGTAGQPTTWTRVDSAIKYDDPSAIRSWWVGDNFTNSPSWRRSYRLLGAGVQSNFAGRPDIQVLPRPTLNGFLVEPSAYELFLSNQKVGKGQFESGRFEFNNLPAVSANGDVRVVFQDALGNQHTQVVPFYVSPRQLAPGLHDYQFNVGKLRTGFNGDASDYGDWLMAGEYGLGLTDWWTVRAASELAKDQGNVGTRNVFSLRGMGSLTLDTAASINNHVAGGYVALQSDWRRSGWNLTLSADKRSKDFWRIGDSLTTSALRQSGYAASVGYGLGEFGDLGFASAIEKKFDGTRTKSVSASYAKKLSDRAYLTVTGNAYKGSSNSRSLYVMLSYNFDSLTPTRVLTSAQNTENGTSFSTSFMQDETEALPIGIAVSVGSDAAKNRSGALGLNWTPEVTAIHLNVSQATSNSAGTQTQIFASGSGSITATSYGIFPSARIYDSAVLIDLAGSPAVRTHVGGRSVKTNASGYALVPQASGYAQNQAMFEPSDLPLEVGFSSQIAQVTAWPRSVALVKFDIANTEGESFRVLDKSNNPMKVGSEVLLAEENQFIGRDGALYLASRSQGNEVKIKTPESVICTAKLPARKSGQARSELIVIICE